MGCIKYYALHCISTYIYLYSAPITYLTNIIYMHISILVDLWYLIVYLSVANRIYFAGGQVLYINWFHVRAVPSSSCSMYNIILYTPVSSIDAKYQNKKTHALAYRLQVRLTFTFCTNILYYTYVQERSYRSCFFFFNTAVITTARYT